MAHRRERWCTVHGWAEIGAWEERHEELLREAERGRLAHKAREGRVSARRAASRTEMPEGIEVRWGLLEDEAKIADLLQLNGMPRWVAFEERYVVAERNGKTLGALRYRTEAKRLLDRKSTRLNSSHAQYLVCRLLLEKKKNNRTPALQYT